MVIERLDGVFTVCKAKNADFIDLKQDFIFVGKTDKELSIVCREVEEPANITEINRGWTAFRVSGTLDFSLVGIIAKISDALAKNGIPIFVVSTFDTDYVLTAKAHAEKAYELMKNL